MRNTVTDFRPAAITPYDVVRFVLGLILLTAAALKGHQLATEPVAETGLLTSRWFLIGVVEFELFFGLWLLAGLYPRLTWATALVCFSGFACVSLYKAVSGEASCGCFGKVAVNPWYTFLLDVAAVIAPLWCRPNRTASGVVQRDRRLVFRPAEVGIVCLAVGIPAAAAMASYEAAMVGEAGRIFGNNEFVILEPETWVGKRFPLLNYIDIGDRLARGEWMVILYRHDCPHCRETILKYEQLARCSAGTLGGVQVALVEIPPYDRSPVRMVTRDSPCVLGHLNNVKQWFVTTPVKLVLVDGTVTWRQFHGQSECLR